jgi:subtilase family serine protease
MARSFLTGAAFGVALLTAPLLAQAAQTGFVGTPAAAQNVSFSVHLPLRNEAQLEQLVQLQGDRNSPLYHHFLSVQQFRTNYGPSPQSIAQAVAALRARGLTVVGQSSQTLRVSGATATVEKSFGTRLGVLRNAKGSVRIASIAPVNVPAELAALGATVTGFEQRVHFHVHSRQAPLNRYSAAGPYWFDDLKQAYTYPSDRYADGTGANVGVMMSSDIYDSDTQAAFAHEKYTAISGKTPLPLKRRLVLGGGGFVDPNAQFEATIDVQESQGSAPGAQVYLYNIPDLSDEAVLAGYTQVVEENVVDVLSSSFGGFELSYSAAYNNGVDLMGILKAQHELFLQGNSQGITFTASSGDSAGLGALTVSYLTGGPTAKFIPGVENPADDPNVTAVGGTNLETTMPPSPQPTPPVLRSKYKSESEFGDPEVAYDPYGVGVNATGGYWGSGSGTSVIYKKPWYQYLVKTGAKGRAIPDISLHMGGCPQGLAVLPCNPADSAGAFAFTYQGVQQLYAAIGTSLSSPEFAGLLGVKVGLTHQRLGNANGYIYELAAANDALPANFPTKFYHQGIPGYNGVVNVPGGRRGYNPIVGVGTPYAQNFLGVPQAPLAGDPQTLSNP